MSDSRTEIFLFTFKWLELFGLHTVRLWGLGWSLSNELEKNMEEGDFNLIWDADTYLPGVTEEINKCSQSA
jgi:hypothetical protein